MAKKTLIYGVLGMLLFLTSCGLTWKYAQINADMSLINIGMKKDTVMQRIGKPEMVIASRSTPEGNLEIHEYVHYDFNSRTNKQEKRPVWVYFLNNEVVEWGPGEDWEIDNAMTDRLIEKYRRNRHPEL